MEAAPGSHLGGDRCNQCHRLSFDDRELPGPIDGELASHVESTRPSCDAAADARGPPARTDRTCMQKDTRKLTHILAGPCFVLSWPLYRCGGPSKSHDYSFPTPLNTAAHRVSSALAPVTSSSAEERQLAGEHTSECARGATAECGGTAVLLHTMPCQFLALDCANWRYVGARQRARDF